MTGQRYFDPNNPGAFAIDEAFYDRLRGATDKRRQVDKFVVPPRTGRAWNVQQGQLCRIVSIEGPQVADFNAWNAHNPAERFWCARSRQLNGAHVTTYSRLWTTLPYFRPMLTFVDDTVPLSESGVRAHDLLGSRCDPYMYKFVEGADVDYTCHSLLTRAIAPHGLKESDVHDVLNLFQPTYLDPNDERPVVDAVTARKGDYIEFFAEIDLLCAIGTCHSGDFSISGSQVSGGQRFRDGRSGDPFPTNKPLGVEIYDVEPELLQGWAAPQPVSESWVHEGTAAGRVVAGHPD